MGLSQTPEMDRVMAGYAPPRHQDVLDLERDIGRQLKAPNEQRLRFVGYGSFAIAVAHPAAEPRWVLKRLPPGAKGLVETYRMQIERYISLLEGVGTRVVPSSLHIVPGSTGGWVLYIAQPLMPSESLVNNLLQSRTPSDTDEVLVSVLNAVLRGTTPVVGTDGNFPNWAWLDGKVWHFDISTPFMKGVDGRPELDVSLMLKPYLFAIRPYYRWVIAPQILERYHDFRASVVDAISLFPGQGLSNWIPAATSAANRLLDAPVSVEEVMRAAREDVELEGVAYQMRLLQRTMVRLVGGTYQFLMPPPPARVAPG